MQFSATSALDKVDSLARTKITNRECLITIQDKLSKLFGKHYQHCHLLLA